MSELGKNRHSVACSYKSFRDRKSTRLNSSHRCISYAVFCLKKKNSTISRLHRRPYPRSASTPCITTRAPPNWHHKEGYHGDQDSHGRDPSHWHGEACCACAL